jgi:hypothetical protein
MLVFATVEFWPAIVDTHIGMSGKPASRPAKSGMHTGPGRGRMAADLCGAERNTQRTWQPRWTGRARPRSGTQAGPARPPVSVHRGTMGSQTGNERRGVTEDV